MHELEWGSEHQAIFKWLEHPDHPSGLICARAGTGKTTTLVAAYRQLRNQGHSPLVLTFSNSGRDTFIKRCRSHYPELPPPQAYTFDGYALRVFSQYSGRSRLRPRRLRPDSLANLIDLAMNEAIDILNGSLSEDELRIPRDSQSLAVLHQFIDNAKVSLSFNYPPFSLWGELDEEEDEYDVDDALIHLGLSHQRYRLFKRYENARERLEFLAPGDAAFDLLREPEIISKDLKQLGIQWVLVDEFHDTKPVHEQILRHMQAAGIRMLAVGDDAQDIYEWRGLTAFSAFKAWEAQSAPFGLSRSFRFGRPLDQIATRLIKPLGSPIEVRSKASHYTRPKLRKVVLEADTTAILEDWQASGRNLGECAILVREADASKPIEDALFKAGISYRMEGSRPYFLRQAALLCQALGYLASSKPIVHDSSDVDAFLALIQSPAWEISEEQISNFQKELISVDYENKPLYRLDWLPDAYAILKGLIPAPMAHLAFVRIKTTPLPLCLEELVDQLNLKPLVALSAPTARAAKARLQLFKTLITELGKTGPDALAKDWFKRRQRYQQFNKQRVVVSSVQQAKGREWVHVILPQLSDWVLREGADSANERRHFYVAITRAQEYLTLLANAQSLAQSPWLEEIGIK
ncbi:UvrD-helicase domain-containing protein [Iodobacter ciconiae]|uniref:DNA 3'-5' helicase n=1 Tax=Iodobacter ciconiae TaxID=2496266 RepID=A0A3S8ZRG2_9NEIS|nr:ATP-dependent helicase [Iodobacter ciconiae]AZN36083.1 ATP-dependent helicase [Iodobacter ciconiae]